MSTLSIFDAAREAPDAIAVIDGDCALSFREIARRAEPVTTALHGARPPALALTPRADVESLVWLYAAFASGTPVLTLHQRTPPPEKRAATELARALDARDIAQTIDVTSSNVAATSPPIDDGSALVLIPTSGSTGTPRIVELSRAAFVASARASAENLGWMAEDRWLLCLPLAHTGGLSIVIRSLLARRTVLLFEPGADGLLARLPELQHVAERATLMSLVPSVLTAWLDARFEPARELRAVLLGGAACSPALAERAHAAHWPLLTSYGLTETASQVVTRRYAERFDRLPTRGGAVSSGHPLPGVGLELRAGRIAVRARSLFSRYLGEPAPPLDAEGWLLTTDHGELGTDGELYVRGRADGVIITGGENVDPLEVEAALAAVPGVQAACVFGTPSEKFGQVVSAVLVTTVRALGEPAHLAELLCDRLARHKLPRLVLIAESLPLTSSGKVDRRACRERFDAEPLKREPA